MESKRLHQMVTLCCPDPKGNIAIGMSGSKDQLQNLLNDLGFEFLNKTPGTDEIRAQLDPENKTSCKIENMVSFLQA